MRTLQRAEEIKKDSRLMNDVKKSITDLQKSVVGSVQPPQRTLKKK